MAGLPLACLFAPAAAVFIRQLTKDKPLGSTWAEVAKLLDSASIPTSSVFNVFLDDGRGSRLYREAARGALLECLQYVELDQKTQLVLELFQSYSEEASHLAPKVQCCRSPLR